MSTAGRDLVFPLIPARHGGSLDVAGRRSRRRGSGDEVASSRPYRRGDPVRQIDWAASARLSTARGSDEFVVRDSFADDAVRIVLVADRSPSMGLFPDWLPWLDKQAAVRAAARTILASGAAANALVGFASVGADSRPLVPARRDPAHARRIEHLLAAGACDGPADSLDRALALLGHRAGTVLPGTFVFVLSDFLPPPSPARLHDALASGWDVVPVVVQDPVWERSFPDVAGVTLPLADPAGGVPTLVRLGRREVRARRVENERRADRLRTSLAELELDPVSITTSDVAGVHRAFLQWAGRRRERTQGAR
jgi:uncharacterized protein (DUF58 family)